MAAPGERAKATALGLARYFTGKPCKHAHIAERRTDSGACVICDRERQRGYDAKNREERRRKNRDRKRVKHQSPEAQAERLDKFRAWKKRSNEPKPLSLVAYQGPNTADGARAWAMEQAMRLEVDMRFITDGVRNGWTLTEIEMMDRKDAGQLADHVRHHKNEDGFTRWEDFNPVLNVGAMD